MKLTIALLCGAVSATLTPTFDGPSQANRQNFLTYTARFGKSYKSTDEFETRLGLFSSVDLYIKDYESTTVTLDHNKFSDWTQEEKEKLLPTRKSAKSRSLLVEDDDDENDDDDDIDVNPRTGVRTR